MTIPANPYVISKVFFDNNKNQSKAASGAQRRDNPFDITDQFIPQSALLDFNPPSIIQTLSSGGMFLEADRALVERTRDAFGLTDRDAVQVFVIPANQRGRRGLQAGSHIYRPTSSRRTQQLSISINRITRQLREEELNLSASNLKNNFENCETNKADEKEENKKARELHSLRMRLTEYRRLLRQENQRLANAPRRGWIVVEREE